jgi:hypothetical protein
MGSEMIYQLFCKHLPRKTCESVEGSDFEMGIFHGYAAFPWKVFANLKYFGVCDS